MKVCTCDNKGTWSDEISDDASMCYQLLPNAPNDRFRMLVGCYNLRHPYYRFAARRGENEGLIVEELSEKEARSLTLAYLKGENVFRAARGKEDGISALIRQFPVSEEEGSLLIMLGAGVSLRNDRNFSNDLADRIRNYKMQREIGPRIILSDSRAAVEGEDPDLQLFPAKFALTRTQIIVGAAIIGVVLIFAAIYLHDKKKNEEVTTERICKCTDAQPKCSPGCTCKTTNSCTCPPEASAKPVPQQSATERKETPQVILGKENVCTCATPQQKCGTGCACKTTKSCTCPPEASAESERHPVPAEQKNEEVTTEKICKCTDAQPKCSPGCTCKTTNSCTCPPEASAKPVPQQSATERKETPQVILGKENVCTCATPQQKCGTGCACKTTKSCTCPPEASAESEQLPTPAEQESSSHE